MKNWHLRLSVCLAFTWFSIIRCSEICSIRLWSDYSSSASENISNTRPDSIAIITTLLHVPSNWIKSLNVNTNNEEFIASYELRTLKWFTIEEHTVCHIRTEIRLIDRFLLMAYADHSDEFFRQFDHLM